MASYLGLEREEVYIKTSYFLRLGKGTAAIKKELSNKNTWVNILSSS